MTAGTYYLGRAAYTEHLKQCPVLEKKLADETAAIVAHHEAQKLLRRANLLGESRDTLEGWRRRWGIAEDTREGLRLATQFAAACQSEKPPRTGFTLEGGRGAGKTTLAIALCQTLCAAGVDVRFERVPDLYNRALTAMRQDGLERLMGGLTMVRVLVLDDLGREKATPWWVDQVLFPLVDARYVAGRPIVATTNYPWHELEALYAVARNDRETAHSGPYVVDRLMQRSASVPFGGAESKRKPEWDFLRA